MKLVRTIADMQQLAMEWHRDGKRIGLVPTMGYLHEGHLSLVDVAASQSEEVVVSIFVNPSQFGPGEDLARYPRDFERDRELCESRGAAAIFCPSAEEMYAEGSSTWVIEEKLTVPLCGASRPAHFRGVTTVVAKLLNAVLPDVAVFGQKDGQQALVIQRMVRDLNFPVAIVVAPIVREADGLAMSSRNTYLTEGERDRSLSISRGLRRAQEAFANGERHAPGLRLLVAQEIQDAGGRIDYVEMVSRQDLRPLVLVGEPAMLAVAAFFGKTRLIDNCFLG